MADHNIVEGDLFVTRAVSGGYVSASLSVTRSDNGEESVKHRAFHPEALARVPSEVQAKICTLDLIPPTPRHGAPVQIIPDVGTHNTLKKLDGEVIIRYAIPLTVEQAAHCEAAIQESE